MRRIVTVAVVATALWGSGLSGTARAQAPVTSFDQVASRVKVGDTVYVVDEEGQTLKGKVVTLSPSSLALVANDQTHDFSAAQVKALRVRKHDSVLNGALIGVGAGVLAGLVQLQAAEAWDFEMPSEAAYYLLFAGMGAGIGIAVDALIPGKKVLVYSAPSASSAARLSVSPLISPRRQGLAVSVRF